MSYSDIYLYGCGGHGKVILDILQCQGRNVKAFVDDHPPTGLNYIHGVPILPTKVALSTVGRNTSAWIVSIGNNLVRQSISQKLVSQGYSFTTAIHPSAQIGMGVKIGAGTVIMANVVINCDTAIGQHAIINTGATVDHDCLIGDYVHIAPGSALCGQVNLGSGVFIGVGSALCPMVQIGSYTTCGAGSLVLHSLPANSLAYGSPAKVVRQA